MEIIPLHIIFSFLSVLVPIVLGFHYLYRLNNDLKLLLLFLIIAVIFELVIITTAIHHINNLWLFHIWTLLEVSFLLYILSFWQNNPSLVKLLRWSILGFVLIWVVLKILGIENFQKLNNISRSLGCVVLTITSLYSLYKTSFEGEKLIYHDYRFWICLAILIYFAGNIIIFALGSLMDKVFMIFAWIIHAGLNITHNLCFAGGFLCLRRQ